MVTEKFAALVEIGGETTRMKDLYDLHTVLPRETFNAALMRTALDRSFAARGTPREAVAMVLSGAFAQDPVLQERLSRYARRTGLDVPTWPEVMAQVRAFYGPLLLEGLERGTWLGQRWNP